MRYFVPICALLGCALTLSGCGGSGSQAKNDLPIMKVEKYQLGGGVMYSGEMVDGLQHGFGVQTCMTNIEVKE
jgi:hypothetical protein